MAVPSFVARTRRARLVAGGLRGRRRYLGGGEGSSGRGSAPTWRRRAPGSSRGRRPVLRARRRLDRAVRAVTLDAETCGWPSSGDARRHAALFDQAAAGAAAGGDASPSRSTAANNQPVAWVGRSKRSRTIG